MPAMGMAAAEQRRLAVDLAGGAHLRQHGAGHAEDLAAGRRPSRRCGCCRASCARRCSRRSRGRCAAGEIPDQPGVDGAEGELPGLRLRHRAGHVVAESTAAWWRRNRRRSRGRSSCGSAVSRPRAFSLSHIGGGAAILPDDGVADRACPVLRSQTTVVSRWLVMPMAAMSAAVRRAFAQRLGGDAGLGGPDLLAGHAPPSRAWGRSGGTPSAPTATMEPA